MAACWRRAVTTPTTGRIVRLIFAFGICRPKRCSRNLPPNDEAWVNLLYSKPLKQFVAVNARGAIERFDVSGDFPKPMRPLESDVSAGQHTVFEIALAPDGLTAAVARLELSRIDLWNLASEQVAQVSAPVAASGMSFMPDGQRLILYEGGLGSWNGQLVIRNLQTQSQNGPGFDPAFHRRSSRLPLTGGCWRRATGTVAYRWTTLDRQSSLLIVG